MLAIDPGVVAWLALAEFLYVRAVRTLRQRGVTVSKGQQTCWHGGVALQALGLLSPIDVLGEQLLSAHMAQHLLIADIAAPLMLAGLRTPVIVFMLPKPALVALARRARLRRHVRQMRQPLVAIAIYAVTLYGWHFDFAFQAALKYPAVHALQHASFVGAGVLVWWSALEPKRRRMRGELWKIGHLLGARLVGMFLGMGFVIIRVPVYTDAYGSGPRALGLDSLADQQIAGAMMVVTDIFLMMFALTFFFLRAGQQEDEDARAAAPPQAGLT